jgi:hypothetical protein
VGINKVYIVEARPRATGGRRSQRTTGRQVELAATSSKRSLERPMLNIPAVKECGVPILLNIPLLQIGSHAGAVSETVCHRWRP